MRCNGCRWLDNSDTIHFGGEVFKYSCAKSVFPGIVENGELSTVSRNERIHYTQGQFKEFNNKFLSICAERHETAIFRVLPVVVSVLALTVAIAAITIQVKERKGTSAFLFGKCISCHEPQGR